MNTGTKPFAKYDRLSVIVISSVIFAMASITWGTLPFLIGSFSDALSLSPQQGGLLGTIEQAGLVTGTLIVYFARSRLNWHIILLVGAVVALLANQSSLLATSANILLSVRFIVGLGLGTGMALTLYFIGNTSNPDRAYGMMMAIQIFIFSVFAFISPYLITTWGLTGYVSAVSVCVLTILATLWWLPKRDAAHLADEEAHDKQDPAHLDTGTLEVEHEPERAPKSGKALFGLLSLVAMGFFQIGLFALFAFLERIGSNSSLSLEFIGATIAIGGGGAGVIGGLAAAALADRLGRVIPLTAALAAAFTAVYMLQEGASATSFFIGFTMFNLGWYFGVPYFMANIAAHDPADRLVGMTPTVMTLSLAAAPGLASLFIVGDSYASVNLFAAVLVALAALLILPSARKHEPTA